MRKHVIAILILVSMLFSIHYALADNLSEMTSDELLALRLQINNELAARYKPPVLEDGMTLIDIFPDKQFAIYIRDKIGTFSINDQVTQDDLDRVTDLWINSESFGITSLEGIQYLHNLQRATIITQRGLTSIPDCFDSLPNLYQLDLAQCPITELPPSICNSNIKNLDLWATRLESLPEDIGNMTQLEELDISGTNITELPPSIYNLNLKYFNRNGLDLGE